MIEPEGERLPLCRARDGRSAAAGAAGRHQLDNAGLSIAAVEHLAGFAIEPEALRDGLRQVEWPARLQRLTKGRSSTCCRRAASCISTAGTMRAAAPPSPIGPRRPRTEGKLDVVIAMRATKAADAFLARVAPHVERLRSITFVEPAWLGADAIADFARRAGIADVATAADAAGALADLLARSTKPRRILLCGSLYFAGRVLAENG